LSNDSGVAPRSSPGGSATNNFAAFATPLPANDVAERIRAVVARDSGIVRWGGRTSDLPFVGTVGEYSFTFRRPGRNTFKPFFLGHIREAGGASAVEIEAHNIFSARNPVLLFMTVLAILLVGGSALTTDRGFAGVVVIFGAVLFGAFYLAIGLWQRAEIRRVFGLIERVVSARTVDEARSIGQTVQ
jgi:hypothetical protein